LHLRSTVLQRDNVKLLEVEISTNKKHPEQKYFVFYVSLPYDPQSSETTSYFNKLYAAILQGTGQSDYTLQDDDDHVHIEVTWNSPQEDLSRFCSASVKALRTWPKPTPFCKPSRTQSQN